MAGDWIKMRTVLQTHPKVVRISSALKRDRLMIVGALHAVWSLFDAHSEDGILVGYDQDSLDTLINFPGFSAALIGIAWMETVENGLKLPEFSTHNGASAKKRATESERKRVSRSGPQNVPQCVRRLSANGHAENGTREEKRREYKTNTTAMPDGFDQFWQAYPNKKAKEAAKKAWIKAAPNPQLVESIISAITRAKQSPDWRKDGGQFIPHPATWLNNRRWEDEAMPLFSTEKRGLVV